MAVISVYATNDFRVSFRPFKVDIVHFNWGFSVGLFLVLLGFFLAAGYGRHLGKKDSGYYNGYQDAIDDAVELVEKKTGK